MSRSFAIALLFAVPSVVLAVPGVKSPVRAHAVNPRWNGVCAHEFRFVGTITSRGAGDVEYTWDRSDGSHGGTQVIHFSRPNQRQSVSTNWTLSKPRNVTYHGWEQIRVISPNFIRSNRAAFTLHCR